jgi:hypothetical protein
MKLLKKKFNANNSDIIKLVNIIKAQFLKSFLEF